MANKRTGLAPWSLSREAGIESATVDGRIEVPQVLQPVIDTGFVDKKGNWKGVTSSDEVFRIDATHESIGNGGSVLSPQSTPDFIDMTGYNDLNFAIMVSNGGNYAIEAVMGPATNPYANLSPVNAAASLGGLSAADSTSSNNQSMNVLFKDTTEALTADVWNIYFIQDRLKGQKLMQLKITNNSGGNSDIIFAYLRVV